MGTTQEIILKKINTNVYEIANEIYYATIVIDTNMSEQNPDFFVTYTNHDGEEVQTTVKAGTHVLPIKYGTTVKVVGSEIENLMVSDGSWSFSGTSCTGSISINYVEVADAYIQHIDGTLYTPKDWASRGFANEKANGVAVVRPISSSFVIAKEEGPELAWGGYDTTITGIVTSTSESTAVLDNDGAGNTPKIIEQLAGVTDSEGVTGAPAAEYCAGYTFPNGKIGYLGALGEWKCVSDNRTAIEEAMQLIGGAEIKFTSMYNMYKTSTQASASLIWAYSFNYYGGSTVSKAYNEFSIRAFCPLS